MTVVRRSLQAFASLFLISVSFGQAPKFTITTVVGTNTAGFAGDGGDATAANLRFPAGIAFDSSGNMYIADSFNHRIRKVTSGTISTMAGKGDSGFTGDNAAATAAQLNRPYGVAVDKTGNVYVADTYNDVVRKVTTSGTISTFAGNGTEGIGGDGGNANGALLDTPTAVALDTAGNLYIADTLNNRVRKVGTDGKISTFAGTGAPSSTGDGGAATNAMINRPQGLAVDAAGNVYISDTLGQRVRKVTPDGTITTVAGNGNAGVQGDGGPATNASLNYPKGLAVDPLSGNLYIADWLNSRVRVVTPDGKIYTAAGNGSFSYNGDGGLATSAALRFPWGIAVDATGSVYVADDENNVIRKLTPGAPAVSSLTQSAPRIDAGGAVSLTAFGGFSSVAPGSWIEIHGADLAATTRPWAAQDFHGAQAPTSLEGTSVTIGGQAAYVSYISPNQINAQVPSGVGMGPQDLRVITAAGTSDPQTITVNQSQPGLYAPASLKFSDKQYTEAIFSDGTAFSPTTRPARSGETVVLYGVGFGPVTGDSSVGAIVQHDNNLILPFQVFFGGMPATVSYAGLAPGSIGLYQFNVVVPHTAPGDAVPLTFSLGGGTGQQVLYTAVQQ